MAVVWNIYCCLLKEFLVMDAGENLHCFKTRFDDHLPQGSWWAEHLQGIYDNCHKRCPPCLHSQRSLQHGKMYPRCLTLCLCRENNTILSKYVKNMSNFLPLRKVKGQKWLQPKVCMLSQWAKSIYKPFFIKTTNQARNGAVKTPPLL